MGGFCKERSEKGRGGGKVERKGEQQGPMERKYSGVATDQPHPYKSETRGRTRYLFVDVVLTYSQDEVVERLRIDIRYGPFHRHSEFDQLVNVLPPFGRRGVLQTILVTLIETHSVELYYDIRESRL